MSPDETVSLEERRSRLELRANVIRSRLMRTIDALDVRRHQVAELRQRARRIAAPIGGAILAVAVLAAGTALAIGRVLEARRSRRLDYRASRWLAQLRGPARPSFLEEALRRVALTMLGIVASELAKRGAKNVFDGRMPAGRLLVGGRTSGPSPVVR